MKKKKNDLSNMSALLVLIVLCILLSIAEPAFHSFANFINILQQVTVIAVLALGVNVVIFTGGIDISVGSVVAFSGIVMGKLVVEGGMPAIVGVAAALVIGAAGSGTDPGWRGDHYRLFRRLSVDRNRYGSGHTDSCADHFHDLAVSALLLHYEI